MAACPCCGHDPDLTTAGLTALQKRALDFIAGYIAAHGVSPSVRDIESGLGLRSRSTVTGTLNRLVQRGAIVRLPNHARSIALAA